MFTYISISPWSWNCPRSCRLNKDRQDVLHRNSPTPKNNDLVQWPVWTFSSSTDHRCDLHFSTFRQLLSFKWHQAEGNASETISWWQCLFRMPPILLLKKQGHSPLEITAEIVSSKSSLLRHWEPLHQPLTQHEPEISHYCGEVVPAPVTVLSLRYWNWDLRCATSAPEGEHLF
jgi:hypothetical protein